METQINVTYGVIVSHLEKRNYSTTLNVVDNFRDYAIKCYSFYDEEELKDLFIDYIDSNLELPYNNNEELDDIQPIDIEIVNWETEVFPLLQDLIKIKEPLSCCSIYYQEYDYMYCPKCGKKLL